MASYEIVIIPKSIIYEIEADSPEQAVEYSKEIVVDETNRTLLLMAKYEAREILND